MRTAIITGEPKMYWILFYDVVDDYVAKRAPYRDEHLALARAAYERGELVMAGALADPADGAVLVFQGESPEAAESFAKSDPYVRSGLVTRWRVRKWTVVVGTSSN
jgi:uncharacterized protein YciI